MQFQHSALRAKGLQDFHAINFVFLPNLVHNISSLLIINLCKKYKQRPT